MREWVGFIVWCGTFALGMGGCVTLWELEKRHDLVTARYLRQAQQAYEAATAAMTAARERWQEDLATIQQDLGMARSALNRALNENIKIQQIVMDGWTPEQRQRVEWERRLRALERRAP